MSDSEELVFRNITNADPDPSQHNKSNDDCSKSIYMSFLCIAICLMMLLILFQMDFGHLNSNIKSYPTLISSTSMPSSITMYAARNYLVEPETVIRSDTGITNVDLIVTPHRGIVKNKDDKEIAEITIRAFEYNGKTRFIGPTIHAKPGDVINVTLINNLTGVGRIEQIDKLMGTNLHKQVYKDPDVTNLHLHGLHVDPNIDNVLLYTSPRCSTKIDPSYWDLLDCYDETHSTTTQNVINQQNYLYKIPINHYPGTHWYHAHWHGSVTFDIIQGLYGLIIIDDEPAYKPDMIPIELLIGYAWLHDDEDCFNQTDHFSKNNGCSGNITYVRPTKLSTEYPFHFPIQSVCFINCKMQNEIGPFVVGGKNWTQTEASSIGLFPVNITAPNVTTGTHGIQLFLVNGQIQPVIAMNTSNWYHFRMVNIVMNYLLFWVANDTTAQNCDIKVMGQDGIYFPKSRNRSLYEWPYENRKVVLPPGSRADLAIHCKCPLELATNGKCDYHIYASSKFEIDKVDSFAPLPFYDVSLLIMEVSNSTTDASDSIWTDWIPQPYTNTPYLKPTKDVAGDAFCSQGDFGNNDMTQCNIVHGRISYPGGACAVNKNACSKVALNQVAFNATKSLAKVCVGNSSGYYPTHEWMVTTNYHPFHHHTWPFQVQRDISKGIIAIAMDWRDTVGAAGTFRMKSNYYTKDFEGFTDGALIMHCHYVRHEDHGMMAQVKLVSDCDSIKGKYIVPTEDSSTIKTVASPDTNIVCSSRNATAWMYLDDADGYIGLELSISEQCKMQFKFVVIPRSVTVGNLWIGIGIDSSQSNFDINNPSWPGYMNGDALIVNVLATKSGPLKKVSSMEVTLNPELRTTKVYAYNYFDCDGFDDEYGILTFKCSRPICSTCNSISFSKLNDGDRNFIFAYGEGQFKPNKTYHSSRGGCAFSFGNIISCNISQNTIFYYTKKETIKTTEIYTTSTTEKGASLQTLASKLQTIF